MQDIIVLIILICIGFFAGRFAESRHYKSIEKQEKNLSPLPVVTYNKIYSEDREVEKVNLVMGSAVISIDYFKRFLAGLRNLFGGEVTAYESLLDRARREAILRMKEQALGADIVLNLRIETSSVGQRATSGQSVGSVEAIAYGTAVTLKK